MADQATASRHFRPSAGAVIFTIPAVLLMLALGTWQVQRLHWKTDLIARIDARLHAAPVPLPAHLREPTEWEFRPVTVTGRFMAGKELLLLARPHQGQAGYEVLAPLRRSDGGGVVLVNRGFLPMEMRASGVRPESGQPEGEVSVHGVVRLPHPAGWLQPDNRPGADSWMRVEPPAMATALGLPALAPLVVEALPDPARSGVVLNGIAPGVELPNNHLQYAITWYGLAATLIVIFVLSQFRRPASLRDRPE